MPGFENTALWKQTLGGTGGPDEETEARERLRNAYLLVRQRAAVLAAEIPLDLREYTVHDASHLDALWETADEIIGGDAGLNPADAFVLGCAFLIHDLGMGLAAYPGGIAQLQEMDVWPGIVAASIEQQFGRPATPEELQSPPEKAVNAAKEVALRELHARQAEALATISWTSSTGQQYHLIEDQPLRDVFGPLIGRIAHSTGGTSRGSPKSSRRSGGPLTSPRLGGLSMPFGLRACCAWLTRRTWMPDAPPASSWPSVSHKGSRRNIGHSRIICNESIDEMTGCTSQVRTDSQPTRRLRGGFVSNRCRWWIASYGA